MKPTPAEFTFWRRPRRSSRNPEDQTNIFWFWCVDNKQDAFGAVQELGGPDSSTVGPCWSAVRFGQTRTELPDGSFVSIGGEHEDHYDPDFYIYNDVWVESPEGELTIYGYPRADFPPTDFHSATLVGHEIWVIGNLGYPEDRNSEQTQVLKLDTRSWKMSRVETQGSPGWISRHQADYDPSREVITFTKLQRWSEKNDLADDFSTWELDLQSLRWRCVEMKDWTQYRFRRRDGESCDLAQIRMAAEMQGLDLNMAAGMIKDAAPLEGMDYFQNMQAEMLKGVDTSAIEGLYRPSIDHKVLPSSTDEFLTKMIEIGGIKLRFVEEFRGVLLTIEGILPEHQLQTLLKETCEQMQAIDGAEYQATMIQ